MTVGLGEGVYPDEDKAQIRFNVRCPVRTVWIEGKSKVKVQVWADEFWGWRAESKADMKYGVTGYVWFLCWPYCP